MRPVPVPPQAGDQVICRFWKHVGAGPNRDVAQGWSGVYRWVPWCVDALVLGRPAAPVVLHDAGEATDPGYVAASSGGGRSPSGVPVGVIKPRMVYGFDGVHLVTDGTTDIPILVDESLAPDVVRLCAPDGTVLARFTVGEPGPRWRPIDPDSDVRLDFPRGSRVRVRDGTTEAWL